MDPIFIAVNIFAFLILLLLSLFIYSKSRPSKPVENVANEPVRRVQGARNQRERMRQNNARRLQAENVDVDVNAQDEADSASDVEPLEVEKMGAKKRAKLEMKAEKKAQRENEQKLRDERKKREQEKELERQQEKQKEELEEKQREEQLKKEIEERERREQEEYERMKAAFQVDEEGYDETEEDANQLVTFVNYIKDHKVVVLEDLALHFKLKTQAVIDRIQDLQKDNVLTGVIDDRGKFIYVSQKDLDSVVAFIKQRGRVSITELAENSNKLINLQPVSS